MGAVTSRPQAAHHDLPAAEEPTTGKRVNVLGVGVSAITMADALSRIDHWIARRANQYICVTGVHGVMESQLDPALRAIHNRAGLVTPDGMPLVWISRLRGHREVERVYGPDLMLACCEASVAKGYRHFFYGRARRRSETAVRAAAKAVSRAAGCRTMVAARSRAHTLEEQATLDRINAADPHIVWVRLSHPNQETVNGAVCCPDLRPV